MFPFKYRYEPHVNKYDIEEVATYMKTFDKLSFNTNGEWVFTFDTFLSIFGEVVVSWYEKENHYQVYDAKDKTDRRKVYFSGYLSLPTEDKDGFPVLNDRPTIERAIWSKIQEQVNAKATL